MLERILPNSSNNLLLADARRARKLPNWLGTCLLSLAFLIGAIIIAAIPAAIFMVIENQGAPSDPIANAVLQAGLNILAFAPLFFVLWIWVRLYEKRPFWTLGLRSERWAARYLRGFLIGAGMIAVAVAVLWLAGQVQFHPDPVSGVYALPASAILLLGWMIQGPAEEILCRGWMMPVLGARYSLGLGVLLSSLIFSFYHSLNPSFSPVAVINLILAGIFLCLFTLIDQAVWGVFGWHTAWNWAQGNIFGMQVSGTDAGGGSIFHFHSYGASILTGGGFGPEGGLVVTGLLVFAILAAGLVLRRQSSQRAVENPV